MTLPLDHLVILVADLESAIADYSALGFTVQRGGTHADGNTHNALVGFEDGSYLELIAFIHPAPGHRWGAFQAAGIEGFVDLALLPPDVGSVVEAARQRGVAYQGPFDGGRLRPDGERLAWQIGAPPSPDLPFLCGDLTPRHLRVREGEVRVHANRVQGVARVTLAVRNLEQSLAHWRALLGAGAPVAPKIIDRPGEGLRQVILSLGTTEIELLGLGSTLEPASAVALQHHLDTRGEGVIGVLLRGKPGAQAGALPRGPSHGARLTITVTA